MFKVLATLVNSSLVKHWNIHTKTPFGAQVLRINGDYTFILVSPSLWNRLPEKVQKSRFFELFKPLLNKHLSKLLFFSNTLNGWATRGGTHRHHHHHHHHHGQQQKQEKQILIVRDMLEQTQLKKWTCTEYGVDYKLTALRLCC